MQIITFALHLISAAISVGCAGYAIWYTVKNPN